MLCYPAPQRVTTANIYIYPPNLFSVHLKELDIRIKVFIMSYLIRYLVFQPYLLSMKSLAFSYILKYLFENITCTTTYHPMLELY